MSVLEDHLQAGLVFYDPCLTDAEPVARWLGEEAEAKGDRVVQIRVTPSGAIALHLKEACVHLTFWRAGQDRPSTLDEDQAMELDFDGAEAILHVSVHGNSAPVIRRTLAWAAYSCAQSMAADFIHWQHPERDLSVEDFILHNPAVQPQPVKATDHLPALAVPPPSTEVAWPELQTAATGTAADNRMRLATWMVSFSIALFALPVATALFIINLLRGEDLRLAANCMALTGLLVTTSHAQLVPVLTALSFGL